MVVLDAIHRIQAEQAPDLAVRWNCKAGKCGSCSAEINGTPKLMCMTRLNSLNLEMPVIVEPMHAFASIRDLVTDVSWNYRVKKTIKPFKPRSPDAPDGTWRMRQADVERVQEFGKCIECFLCQDVCHVLREHRKFDEFIGPASWCMQPRPRVTTTPFSGGTPRFASLPGTKNSFRSPKRAPSPSFPNEVR